MILLIIYVDFSLHTKWESYVNYKHKHTGIYEFKRKIRL